MGFRYKWALGATVLVTVAALIAGTIVVPARQDNLEAAGAALEHGIQLYQQGSYDAAQAELGQALEDIPDEWRVPYYLGIIQIQLKQYMQAIPYLEQAFLLNPAEPKIPNALGVSYFKLGMLDLAKGYFTASLELEPLNADTRAMVETMAKLQRKAVSAPPAPGN